MIPDFLIEKLQKQYGKEIVKNIVEGYSAKRAVTFRVNTLKMSVEEVKKLLDKLNIKHNQVSWSNEAFIIQDIKEDKIQELNIYKNGEIYLQSLSSMLPPIILEPKENTDILDMAAAPGGKTTQMAALSKNGAHITACEMNKIRAERLKYNIEKQGASSVYVMEKDARQIDDFFSFDQILLDAPCSGSGTLDSTNPKNEQYFTEKLIQKSVISQKALLRKAITILKKGHEMVYSTCSILKEENEDIINTFLKEKKVEIVPIDIKDLPHLPVSIQGTICIAPNELYEGFFIAKLRKRRLK